MIWTSRVSGLLLLAACAGGDDPASPPLTDDTGDLSELPELIWALKLEDQLDLCSARIEGFAQVVDDTVVVGVTDNCSGASGHVVGLDPSSGAVLWDAALGGPVVPGTPVYSSATGLLYVVAQPNNHPGSDVLAAVSPSDGSVIWSTRGCSDSVMNYSPLVSDGMLFSACDDEDGWAGAAAFDAASGEQIWAIANGYAIEPSASPAVDADSGAVFFAGQGGLQAIDAASGDERWLAEGWFASVVVPVAGIVVASDRQTGEMTAFDVATGAEVWSQPNEECFVVGLHAVDGTLLQAGCGVSIYDQVAAYDPLNGALLWRVELGSELAGGGSSDGVQPPFVENGEAYYGTDSGFCPVKLSDGTPGSCVGDLGRFEREDGIYEQATCTSRPALDSPYSGCTDADGAVVMAFGWP